MSLMDESRFHIMDHVLDLKTPSPYETRHNPSPIFKTPGKYVALSQNSPRYKTTPNSMRSLTTPKRRINAPLYNPFDNNTIDVLHLPTFSPNVFSSKGTSTPSRSDTTPQKFRWSIDQQAILNPADIDEMPHQHHLISVDDDNTDFMAQQAIDTFFASHIVVPSPWSDTNKTMSRLNDDLMKAENNFEDNSAKRNPTKSSASNNKKDASCQTTLTIPADIDLQAVLGEFFTYIQDELASGADVLSTSTLRRKLFFNGDIQKDGSVASGSSIKTMSSDHSPAVSPLRGTTPEKHSPIVTPASTQFSSSPITSAHRSASPSYRRGSFEFGDHISSPELSPINTPVSKPRYPLTASAVRRLDVETLFGSAHGSNMSPSCGRPSVSPDISPIANEEKSKSDEKDISPKVRTRIEFGTASAMSPGTDSENDGRNETAAMDVSSGFQDLVLPVAETQPWPWGLSTIREISMSECEITNAVSKSTYSANQDTGYQTGSLQSATDLTSQMGSLPLSSRDCTMADDTELDSVSTNGCESVKNYANSRSNMESAKVSPFTDITNFKSTSVFKLFANCGQQTNVKLVNPTMGYHHSEHQLTKMFPPQNDGGLVANVMTYPMAPGGSTALGVPEYHQACIDTSPGTFIGWNPVGSSTPEKLDHPQDYQID